MWNYRLCDSYDALPNTSSKQTTPTALYNPSFASLNSQQLISNGTSCNEHSSIYKCSSDCCSVERQRHNHNSQHSHFNHNNNINNNNNNGNSNKHRKQKTSKQQQQQQQQQQLHHHLRQSNNNNSNKQPQKQSPQEPEYHNHNIVNTPSDPNHVNYEYIGEQNGIEDDGALQTDVMGHNVISENDEDVTTEHDEDDEEEEEDPINSYSCDDTITDDIVLAGSNHIDRRNNKANKYFISENGTNPAAGGHCEHTNGSGGSRGSGSGGDTCCSCSDVSCVYEEPPNHPPLPTNKNQMLRIGEDN